MYEETHTKNIGDNIVDAHSIPTMQPYVDIYTLSGMTSLVVKYGQWMDTYYDEVELCAQNKTP